MIIFRQTGLVLLALGVLIVAAGCAVTPRGAARVEPVVLPEEEVEAPLEYKLGPGDIVEVKFFYNSELNEMVTVRPDGRITLQRIGDLLVAGLTPSELDGIITERFSEILKRPEVTVFVRKFADQNVYVLGEVDSPGGYPVVRGMTVVQAIAQAGGYRDTAELKSVMLITKDSSGNPNAQRLDLTKLFLGTGTGEAPPVHAYDIVYVPKTFISKVNVFVDQFFAKMLPPLYLYIAGYDITHLRERYRR